MNKKDRFILDVNKLIYINYLDEAQSNSLIVPGATVLVVTENMHYQCYDSDGIGRYNIGGGRYLQKTGYKVFNDDSVVEDENSKYDSSVGDNIPVGYKTFMALVEKVHKLGSIGGGGTEGGGSDK